MMNLTDLQINQQTPKPILPLDILQFVPGIWVNGQYFWLQNCTEKVIYDEELIIKVKQEQLYSNIRFSSVYVSNHGNQTKEIKVLVMHYFLYVGQDHLVFVSPIDRHIFHHANQKVFLVNAQYNKTDKIEYTAIPQWNAYTDQIWGSIQKGNLKYQPMAKGPAASIFAVKMSISPHETSKMNTWTITGSSKNELISIEKALIKSLGST